MKKLETSSEINYHKKNKGFQYESSFFLLTLQLYISFLCIEVLHKRAIAVQRRTEYTLLVKWRTRHDRRLKSALENLYAK